MSEKRYAVCCIYCENFKYNFASEKITVFDKGFCEKKKEVRFGFNAVCDDFELRQGLHIYK